MTRDDYRQKIGTDQRELTVDVGDNLLFARMGACCKPHRPSPDLLSQVFQLQRVDRQGIGCGFQVASHRDFTSAEAAKALGLLVILGQAQREGAQHRTDQSGQPLPAHI